MLLRGPTPVQFTGKIRGNTMASAPRVQGGNKASEEYTTAVGASVFLPTTALDQR